MSSCHKGSIIGASIWMLIISTLLFWLPFIGPAIGGLVGGKHAGSVGRAILAVFFPVVVAGVLIFVFAGSITGIPVIGAIAGMGATAILICHVGPLLLGGIIGGLF